MRTRWNVNGSIFDMVNVHLFHDASNLIAAEEYPSIYCKSRRRALVHILERYWDIYIYIFSRHQYSIIFLLWSLWLFSEFSDSRRKQNTAWLLFSYLATSIFVVTLKVLSGLVKFSSLCLYSFVYLLLPLSNTNSFCSIYMIWLIKL